MMDSSPSKTNVQSSLPSTAGVKRPAPTLLPAFEPLSSSPGLPRPLKRQARSSPSEREVAYMKYPTPIPTSTTGILSSSPPQFEADPVFSERNPPSRKELLCLPYQQLPFPRMEKLFAWDVRAIPLTTNSLPTGSFLAFTSRRASSPQQFHSSRIR